MWVDRAEHMTTCPIAAHILDMEVQPEAPNVIAE